MPPKPASRLSGTYLELHGDSSVGDIALTPEFWPYLMSGTWQFDGRLIMSFELTEDMGHWTRALHEGRRGLCGATRTRWHRLNVIEPGEVVFMTPDEGPEHKPL